MCSARLNPALADRYAEVERRISHRFRTDLTLADIIAEPRDTGQLALIPSQTSHSRRRGPLLTGPHSTAVFGFASDDNEA